MLCQAALGLKPKAGERVTVFLQSGESPELAIGSLTMGTCDQFSLGTGLTFSSGETVSVRHNGSAAVCLTGRIEDDFDDLMGSLDATMMLAQWHEDLSRGAKGTAQSMMVRWAKQHGRRGDLTLGMLQEQFKGRKGELEPMRDMWQAMFGMLKVDGGEYTNLSKLRRTSSST